MSRVSTREFKCPPVIGLGLVSSALTNGRSILGQNEEVDVITDKEWIGVILGKASVESILESRDNPFLWPTNTRIQNILMDPCHPTGQAGNL